MGSGFGVWFMGVEPPSLIVLRLYRDLDGMYFALMEAFHDARRGVRRALTPPRRVRTLRPYRVL